MIKSILLTGDDGYNSIGTRLLIHVLRDSFQLTVAGTQEQQSGMGGKLSMKGFHWGKTSLDGIEALWVDGSPVDAIELAESYYDQPFDLTISGMNLGANLGSAIMSSGTVNAALRAVARGLSPRSIALSWDLPGTFHTMPHKGAESLTEYLEYPGKAIKKVLDLVFKHDLWQAPVLNINFPQEASG